MAKGKIKRQANGSQSNGNRAMGHERAIFTSFGTGRSSYIERNWARMQLWAAVERPDLHPAPMLTEAGRQALREANHVADDHR